MVSRAVLSKAFLFCFSVSAQSEVTILVLYNFIAVGEVFKNLDPPSYQLKIGKTQSGQKKTIQLK